MDSSNSSETSPSLLRAVAAFPLDPAAWGRFVGRYRPKIVGWCRHWGIQEADAEDVAQDVLAKLAARLRRFQYDPARSFRGYLKEMVRGTHLDALASRRPTVGGGSEILGLLETVEARDDLIRRLEAEFDFELFEEAQRRVRDRVEPRTWQAFHLLAVGERPAADVAELLGMRIGTVYQAKSSVLAMIRAEVADLNRDD